MEMKSGLRKVPYFDIADTTEEVGITRRQLGHWQAQGLVVPELGAESKRYTVRDIEHLKVLKRLIVDQQLPISFAKQLMEGGTRFSRKFVQQMVEAGALFSDVPRQSRAGHVIDLDKDQLIDKKQLAEDLWNEFGATADEHEIEQRLYALALLLFRVVRMRYRSAVSYTDRRNEIVRHVEGCALSARIEWNVRNGMDLYPYLDPELRDDPPSEVNVDLREWFKGEPERLDGFQQAATRLVEEGMLPAEQLDRFWDSSLLRAIASEEIGF